MHRCGHNADVYIRCIGVLVTKYVFIVHCVLSICMCILHIVICTVCKYVLSICKLLCFVFCFFCTVWSTLIRISLTKALVLWWCDNKSDLIWFDLNTVTNPASVVPPDRHQRSPSPDYWLLSPNSISHHSVPGLWLLVHLMLIYGTT